MTSHTMSLRISEETPAAHLDDEKVERLMLEAALERAETGEFVPHLKVAAWLRSWGTDNELPPPIPAARTQPE